MVYAPMRLHIFYPNASELCWRKCQHRGNILHTLWRCHNLNCFWKGISQLISEVSGTQFSLTPALALLSLGSKLFPPAVWTVVLHILFAACIAIAQEWKSKIAPTVESVIARVNTLCHFEKLIAHKDHMAHIYQKKWDT